MGKEYGKRGGGQSRAAARRGLRHYLRRYFVDAMGAMAMGLFASVIIGVIFKQLLALLPGDWVGRFAEAVNAQTAASSPVVGAAIGAAIGYVLKVKPLAIYSSAVAGAIAYAVTVGGVVAGPVGAFAAAVVGAECGNWIAGKTPLDILLVPIFTISSGTLVGLLVGPPIAAFMQALGLFVNEMTLLRPFFMGMTVSLTFCVVLVSPISSAALAIMLDLSGLAAGAATAGCAASMVGFAVASYPENRLGGLLAQGLGTSKLQLGNVMAHPRILLPAAAAALVAGPLSTLLFKLENVAGGAGMGTSGLVGQITTLAAMAEKQSPARTLLSLALLHFLVPAAVAWLCGGALRKIGWIKPSDMRIEV